jgi:hypothetical protein
VRDPFALVVEFSMPPHITDALPAEVPVTMWAAGTVGSCGVPVPAPRLTAAVHASVELDALAQALLR